MDRLETKQEEDFGSKKGKKCEGIKDFVITLFVRKLQQKKSSSKKDFIHRLSGYRTDLFLVLLRAKNILGNCSFHRFSIHLPRSALPSPTCLPSFHKSHKTQLITVGSQDYTQIFNTTVDVAGLCKGMQEF